MTLKQAVDIAIASGMTTFTIAHHAYDGRNFEQSQDTVHDFIKGYENDAVMSLHLGNWYSQYNGQDKPYTYPRPTHCHIVYRDENEAI
jgi:hypothetical protein